ncbi:MAG TPA: hypothetical protein VE991_04635, partial [Acidimicrobiales bacterium]|nr:hypothetical protein [Acidimicrobiales bacterium]
CMVPRPGAGTDASVTEPVCVRVRAGHALTGGALSAVIRTWAEGGERVFVELDVTRRCALAVLECGDERVVTDVVNGFETWSPLGGPSAREVAGG